MKSPTNHLPPGALLLVSLLLAPAICTADAGAASPAEGNNAFARQLIGHVASDLEGESFVFSPFSIVTAFGMAYAGAREETAAQIEDVFRFPGPVDTPPAIAAWTDTIESAAGETTPLRIANRLWVQSGWPIKPDFLGILDEHYNAPAGLADFIADPEAARLEINDWVYDQTNERIEDLLPEMSITHLTRLVLANALYFNAVWEQPFNRDVTREENFYVTPDETVRVPMMRSPLNVPYTANDLAEAIAIPVKDGSFSFVVVLPKRGGSVDTVLEAVVANAFPIDPAMWEEERRDVKLPRFRVEGDLTLRPLLERLGVVDAFSAADADFTGIATPSESDPSKLHITSAYHKAFLEVTEDGIEAGAATALGIGFTSMPDPFHVDRPFLIFLTEDSTETILFAGRINRPEAPPAGIPSAWKETLESILGAPVERDGDWYASPIGHLRPAHERWFIHRDFGWTFLTGQDGTVWLWSPGLGWVWTHAGELFPYAWSADRNSWIYIRSATASGDASEFYNYRTESWEPLP